ncbi:MAG: hypothetical protein HQ488_03610 [Parcubacteria group bacterium]|nr:hypothetical protein [Parcubacteria group bacterium]
MTKNRKHKTLVEAFGWVGVLSILMAYALISFDIVESHSLWYHGLNLFGGAGIIIEGVAVKNYQPVALNIIWAMIALYAIVNMFL